MERLEKRKKVNSHYPCVSGQGDGRVDAISSEEIGFLFFFNKNTIEEDAFFLVDETSSTQRQFTQL